MKSPPTVTATAPGKVILFGEHAINRGAPALSAAVGLHARCTASLGRAAGVSFRSGGRAEKVTLQSIRLLARDVNDCRDAESYETIQRLARTDYFAPQKYILGVAYGEHLPDGIELAWESDVPANSGLGSGGSAFVAMVAAVSALLEDEASLEERARRAHLGDLVAHGGIASALDTQTSLLGGVIRFTGHGLAERLTVADGFSLLIANTGVAAATSEVNAKVRHWLNENKPARLPYFQAVGALSRAAAPLLAAGDWADVGRLMNLNQLVLEKIGVSRPEIVHLIDAALAAGALGAKISGSGGGGIIIALVTNDTRAAVGSALRSAGAAVLMPAVAVPGVTVISEPSEDSSTQSA